MKIVPSATLLLLTSLQLGGCAIATSTELSGVPPLARIGVAYMLPKALLPVQLVEADGVYGIEVLDPIITGDPAATYLLAYKPSPLASDEIKISVDPKTNLLQSVNVKAEDKTADILKQIARTAAIAQSSAAKEGRTVIMSMTVDPTDESDLLNLNQKLRQAVQESAKRKIGIACAKPSDDKCAAARNLTSVPSIDVAAKAIWSAAPAPPTGAAMLPPTSCAVGVCYRPALPFRITTTIAGRTDSVVALLPNGAPAVALPLNRAAFVAVEHKIAMKDGMLISADITKPSEALAAASLPLDMLKAFFGTIGELINLRIDLSGREKALAEAKIAELKANKALDNARIASSDREQSARTAGGGILVASYTGSLPRRQLRPSATDQPGSPRSDRADGNPEELIDRGTMGR